ncbi:hypothetical protein HDU78_002127 [Chytriomyces hyalinus]|nr:hypothetical protein HDU78_002127 [Chytriomyces hyalinus]
MDMASASVSSEAVQNQQPQHQPTMLHQQSVCKLYVGNLDGRVDENMLQQFFNVDSAVDLIESIKIIPQPGGINYGFVEYRDAQDAENAIQSLNGKRLLNFDIRVNWAFAGSSSKEDLSSHFHVFVGDLGSEITDQLLAKAFATFGSLSDARVMWDPMSGKSRGYGFVAFKEKADAERAIASMNNEWLGSRTVRVNWANQKTSGSRMDQNNFLRSGQKDAVNIETILAQSHIYNTTVYIGNITPHTTQIDIAPLFSQFGYIRELRLQADKGFGFIKLDSHDGAAMAIYTLNGYMLHGRQLKCSWGKERMMHDVNNFHPMGMPGYGYPQPMTWFFPNPEGGPMVMPIPPNGVAPGFEQYPIGPGVAPQAGQNLNGGAGGNLAGGNVVVTAATGVAVTPMDHPQQQLFWDPNQHQLQMSNGYY